MATQHDSGSSGGILEVVGQYSMADIGEMLALRAQMEQEQQVAGYHRELESVLAQIDELKKRRAELTELEETNRGAVAPQI